MIIHYNCSFLLLLICHSYTYTHAHAYTSRVLILRLDRVCTPGAHDLRGVWSNGAFQGPLVDLCQVVSDCKAQGFLGEKAH